jgi:hypothetical protein
MPVFVTHTGFTLTCTCTKGAVAGRFAAKACHAASSLRVIRLGRRRLLIVCCAAAAGAHRLCDADAAAVSPAPAAAAAAGADSITAGAADAANE